MRWFPELVEAREQGIVAKNGKAEESSRQGCPLLAAKCWIRSTIISSLAPDLCLFLFLLLPPELRYNVK